jgi:alkylresorcinol/alkylpyrone synthase
MMPVFDNAGIDTRYSVVPIAWYYADHGWADRQTLYVSAAVDLLEQAARDCLARAGLEAADIDSVVTVSTTGIATPSLDAVLMGRLGLRQDIRRLPVFGLGCAGGVLGIARAADLARAAPHSRVLFLVVELCSLCFRKSDRSASGLVATALFADGAAAAILSCRGDGPALGAAGEHTWPASLDIMGWEVQDDGLKALFSRDIPALIRERLRPAADTFLGNQGLTLADIDHFVCHPGGAKVLAALEEAFAIDTVDLTESHAVLRDYGNMSAASVLFVLERTLSRGSRGRMLLTAMGPGFTAGFQLLDA